VGVNKDPRGLLLNGPLRLRRGGGIFEGTGSPKSGTYGTGLNEAGKGSLYYDYSNGAVWRNDGTITAPYWVPLSVGAGSPLWGIDTDFRDEVGKAHANTDAAAIVAGSGLRVFGQGVAETDSGAVASVGEGGPVMRLTTTDEVAHTVAIGTKAGVYQPDQHGLGIVDVEFTSVSAITLRGYGIGFVGLAADAFDPPITAATTVATLVQDDLALIHQNVGYTDADRLYVAHNKSDAAADMTVVDSGVNLAAAGTYQRVRVEVDGADGTARFFVNKAQVAEVSEALDEDEEASPVFYIESTSTAVKAVDVRRFLFCASRP